MRRHTAQRRADPRSARSGDPAERRADEPALLVVAACREALRRSCHPASRLGLRAAAEGGRLVAITGHNVGPEEPAWREGFVRLQERGAASCSRAAIAGQAYARHGTTIDTRLTVIDRVPADDPRAFPPSPGKAADAAELLDRVIRLVPPRPPVAADLPSPPPCFYRTARTDRRRGRKLRAAARSRQTPVRRRRDVVELAYETCDWAPAERGRLTASALRGLCAADDRASPARSRIRPSSCSRPPWPPSRRRARPTGRICRRALSRAASCRTRSSKASSMPAKRMPAISPGPTRSTRPATSSPPRPTERQNAVRFRRGWFLGDGTGAGKGRQVAAIILDNWLKGRRRALWISKSDKLIEDAERDWTALGGYRSDLVPLSRFRQGAAIALDEGILFTTYATLRTQAQRRAKPSRVQQIIDWLGRDFDGVVVFDEAHAMANAAGDKGERGEKKPSQQGQAGLRLQHALPDARILYVSATGATTVQNLAYAARLGLWGTGDFPFATRAEFVAAMEGGGIAAMEVLARDLKALGLYAARSLSFEGIEYEIVEHALTPEQIRDLRCLCRRVPDHPQNLNAALEGRQHHRRRRRHLQPPRQGRRALGLRIEQAALLQSSADGDEMPDPDRRDRARSRCRPCRDRADRLDQRGIARAPPRRDPDFGMGRSLDRHHAAGICARLSEATRSRRSCSSSTPTRRATSIRARSPMPTATRCTRAKPSSAATAMIEHLASLPPVQGALDQILHRFGTDMVAEVTGRSRRIVQDADDRLCVETRPGFGEFRRDRRLHG